MRSFVALIVSAVTVFASMDRARGCIICGTSNFQQSATLRQSARTAKFVVLGTLSNPRLNGEKGATDLNIEKVAFGEAAIGKTKMITLESYIPFDPKSPPRFLIFGDVNQGKVDVSRGVPVTGAGTVEYLRSAMAIDDGDRLKVLQFCYKHLDSTDADVATDAFIEFAKATDQEIASLAGKLAPDKFRKMLKDPAHPERHGISAYMLGACGGKDDATLLASMIKGQKTDERGNPALSGLLAGLIELRPAEGWTAVLQTFHDPKRHFSDRLAAIGTVRFYHTSKPKEFRKEILQVLCAVLEQGDMADMAIEDLRRWQWWDATKQVLAQYGKPTHAAPLVRRSIVRYALCCPEIEAIEFVKARRLAEPNVVKLVEESLSYETGKN